MMLLPARVISELLLPRFRGKVQKVQVRVQKMQKERWYLQKVW